MANKTTLASISFFIFAALATVELAITWFNPEAEFPGTSVILMNLWLATQFILSRLDEIDGGSNG